MNSPFNLSRVYLIEQLIIDRMENSPELAAYYTIVGYVNDIKLARSTVNKAGDYVGDGWPIQAGKMLPKLRWREIKELIVEDVATSGDGAPTKLLCYPEDVEKAKQILKACGIQFMGEFDK